jgi:3-methyladenine DNA glycosylase AlkD
VFSIPLATYVTATNTSKSVHFLLEIVRECLPSSYRLFLLAGTTGCEKIKKKIRGNFLDERCTRLLRKVDSNLANTQVTFQEISRELESQADPEWKRKLIQWYGQYREEPKLHGLPTPSIRKLSAKYFSKVKGGTKGEIFRLCEKLLASDYVEERTVAFDWAFRLRRFYEPLDFRVLESWLKKYVHGWGSCDDLCTHAFGAFVFQYPEFFLNVKEWTKSEDRWIRRASAVVMIYSVRRRKHLERIFVIADALLTDPDIMVQKGYGWMLKEASNRYSKEVFDYVMKHRMEMPRTSLRYAIEKFSPELRKEAMREET